MKRNEIYQILYEIMKSPLVQRFMAFDPELADVTIKRCLEEKGLQYLGSGMYAAVAKHPAHPGKAFKISVSRFDGYREYAKFCLARQGDKHIPEIYHSYVAGDYSFYEMKEYRSIPEREDRIEEDLIEPRMRVITWGANGYLGCDDEDFEKYKSLLRVVKNIRVMYKGRFSIDVHYGNVMLDENNEMIITDPIAGDIRREIEAEDSVPVFE